MEVLNLRTNTLCLDCLDFKVFQEKNRSNVIVWFSGRFLNRQIF